MKKIQQGLEIFAAAPEGDFLFLRHHKRFGDGVDRHGGSRSGHGSCGLFGPGQPFDAAGRNRFQMVSVTIWGQHQWIINESSMNHQWIINMFAELGNIWEMPFVHTGDWLLNAVKWPHECYVCQILYGWSHCSETNLDTIRNIHNHLKRRAWQGTIENVYAKKTYDTFNLRIYITANQARRCAVLPPWSEESGWHEIAVLLESRHMVRVPGESVDGRAGRTAVGTKLWGENHLKWRGDATCS